MGLFAVTQILMARFILHRQYLVGPREILVGADGGVVNADGVGLGMFVDIGRPRQTRIRARLVVGHQ